MPEAKLLRNLAGRHPLRIVEFDHRSCPALEFLHAVLQGIAEIGKTMGQVALVGRGDLLDYGVGEQAGLALVPAAMGQNFLLGNADGPGGERAGAIVLRELADDDHRHLLEKVFTLVDVWNERPQERRHRPLGRGPTHRQFFHVA